MSGATTRGSRFGPSPSRRSVSLVAAAVLAGACVAAGDPSPPPDPRPDIRAAGDDFIGLAKNPDSAVTYFAHDALLVSAGGSAVRGREALLGQLRMGAESGDWRSTVERDSIFVSGALALERGRYRIELLEDERPPLTFTGHYLIHWENQQGRWVMGTYMGTADP